MLREIRYSTYSPDGDKSPGKIHTTVSPDGHFVRTTVETGFVFPNQPIELLLQKFIPRIDDFTGDAKIVCLGSKLVSVLQGRYRRATDIHPGRFARSATRFGTGFGVGGFPEKLQAAIDDAGYPRIIAATTASAMEKTAIKLHMLRNRIGVFYIIAGSRAKAIDGLYGGDGYDKHVLLAPANPQQTCDRLQGAFGFPVAIVDINNLGGDILGLSNTSALSRTDLIQALKDNPAGQEYERTPVTVVGRI